MFKLDRKLIISASVVASASLFIAGCAKNETMASPLASTYANGKATIDGGSYYPVSNGMVGPYHVNEEAIKGGSNLGREATKNELAAWSTSVTPWKLPPEGEGSVEEGEEIYESQCVMCHGDFGSGGGGYPSLAKGNAYDGQKSLKNQRTGPDTDGPIRVFGTYWPQASTLWWYIKMGMPHPKTKSLNNDEVYALTAYILNINEMKIDGEEVDDEYVLNREKFSKIVMPNVDGFEPKIDGPNGRDNVRAFYANPANFGAQKVKPSERCMKDCQKQTVKVVKIKIETKDFLPPMSVKRDLPKEKTSGADSKAKATYESSCAVCHGNTGMGAPVVGNKKDWSKVTAKGMNTVYKNAIHGINGMPPKGGTNLSDNEFKSVVDYMIKTSK